MNLGLPKVSLNKKMTTLLSVVLLMHMGAYIVIPLLPVILRAELHFTAAQIGSILGIGAISFQVGSILGGLLSDRIGSRITLLLGAFTQVVALCGYAFSLSYVVFFSFAFLNGIGNGIFAPTIKASIATLISKEENLRTTAFSLRGISANIGIGLGGLITLLLAQVDYIYVFLLSAFIFLSLSIYAWFLIPDSCVKKRCEKIPIDSYKLIFKNKAFMIFSIFSILVWAIYAQLSLLLPLRANAVLSNGKIVGTIWTITSFIVVILQTFISRRILQKINVITAIFIGTLVMGLGIFLIGLSFTYFLLIGSATVFIFGEMFVVPTTDSITSKLAHTELIGTYFSISNLIYGIGTALGSFIGGKVIDTYGINTSLRPWIIIVIFSSIVAFSILLMKKVPSIKKTFSHTK